MFQKLRLLDRVFIYFCKKNKIVRSRPRDYELSTPNKTFPLSEYKINVTAPPYHARCRTTTAPYFDDIVGERIARNADGTQYFVPASMTYNEWYDKYVVGNASSKSAFSQSLENLVGDAATIQAIQQEFAMLPDEHKKLIEETAQEIRIVSEGNSRYDRQQGIVYILENPVEGEVIHEFGHVIETALDLFNNSEYKAVRASGIDVTDIGKIVFDLESYDKPAQILINAKFISNYQGFMNEFTGVFDENFHVNLESLVEYFSEGYRDYFFASDELRDKDQLLYNFIRGMVS